MLPASSPSMTAPVKASQQKSSRLKLEVVETFTRGVEKRETRSECSGRCSWHARLVKRTCDVIAESYWFTSAVLFLIVLNSIFLALYDPLYDPLDPTANEWIEKSEWVFQSLFTVEAFIKIVHLGVKGYFSEAWNVFDFVLVFFGWIFSISLPEANLTALRVFRVLRSLRLLQFIPGMLALVNIFSRSYIQLTSVLCVVLFIIYAFAIIAVELYKNAVPDPDLGVPNVFPGFQNIVQSFFTVFLIITCEGWEDIMRWIVDQYDNNVIHYIFFIFLTALGALLVLNLIVTVLALNHVPEEATDGSSFFADAHRYKVNQIVARAKRRKLKEKVTFADVKRRILLSYERGNKSLLTVEQYKAYKERFPLPEFLTRGLKRRISTAAAGRQRAGTTSANSQTGGGAQQGSGKKRCTQAGFVPPLAFEMVLVLVQTVNVVVLSFGRYGEDPAVTRMIYLTNVTCGCIYIVEIYLRIVWAGIFEWFLSKVLVLEFILIHLGVFFILLEVSRVVFAFRLLVILFFTERLSVGKTSYTKILAVSLHYVAPFTMVLLLLLHIFAVVGLHLFGGKFNRAEFIGYDTYVRSLLSTFQVITGEGWNEVLYEAVDKSGFAVSITYYFLLLVLGNFVILNLILALMINTFVEFVQQTNSREPVNEQEQLRLLRSKLQEKENNSSVKHLQRKWSRKTSFRRQLSDAEFSVSSSFDSVGNSPESEGDSCSGNKRLDWLIRCQVLDLIGLVTTVVYCIGYSFNDVLQLVCVTIFLMEMFLRVAVSLVFKRGSAAHEFDRLLLLDVIVIILSSLHYLYSSPYTLALRPLVAYRLIHWCHPLMVMAATGLRWVKTGLIILLYAFIMLTVFSVLFVELFGGKFYTCFDADRQVDLNHTCFPVGGVECIPERECIGGNLTWQNFDPFVDFDNYGHSMQVLMETMTLELWTEGMFLATQAKDVGESLVLGAAPSANDLYGLLFVVTVCLSHLFLLQIFIAVAIETYMYTDRKFKGVEVLSNKQRLWVDLQIKCIFHKPRQKLQRQGSAWRTRLFHIVDSKRFEWFIVSLILIDSVVMALQHKDEPEWITQLNIYSQIIFGSIYLLEAILKIIAYGPAYFKSLRNLFDLFIVVCVLVGWVSLARGWNLINLTPLRVLRAALILPFLKSFLELIRSAAPAFVQILVIMLFFLYVYSFAAMDLFPGSEYFADIGTALLSLYILAIGDDWVVMMRAVPVGNELADLATKVFFVSFMLVVTFTTINLLIAVMLNQFEQEFVRKSLDQRSLGSFRRQWYKVYMQYRDNLCVSIVRNLEVNVRPTELDAVGSEVLTAEERSLNRLNSTQQQHLAVKITKSLVKPNYLPPEYIPHLLRKLKPPLGLVNFSKGDYTASEVLRLIHLSNLPLTQSNMVNYNALLFALSEFRYRINSLTEELPLDVKTIALKLHLNEENREKFEQLIRQENNRYRLSHYLAAKMIQRAWFEAQARQGKPESRDRHNSVNTSTSYRTIDAQWDEDDEEFSDCLDRSFNSASEVSRSLSDNNSSRGEPSGRELSMV